MYQNGTSGVEPPMSEVAPVVPLAEAALKVEMSQAAPRMHRTRRRRRRRGGTSEKQQQLR